jgi:hypothetical protein
MQEFYRLVQTDSNFDPADIQRLEQAFEKALLALELTSRTDPLMEIIAQSIIEAAQIGEKDPDLICEYVLRRMGIPSMD